MAAPNFPRNSHLSKQNVLQLLEEATDTLYGVDRCNNWNARETCALLEKTMENLAFHGGIRHRHIIAALQKTKVSLLHRENQMASYLGDTRTRLRMIKFT